MLGSLQEAEDQVQETFVRAWRRLDTYEGRASFRAWLYKIATNACLDALDRQPRRILPQSLGAPADPHQTMAPPITETIWIEPFPDDLLAPAEINPEARYEARESITLAFLTALQVLPPRQRAILILRDVLDWRSSEVADLLEITISAVNSGLHRARTTLTRRYPSRRGAAIRAKLPDEAIKTLLQRYLRAWEEADVDGLVSLLKEDATFPMPPLRSWYQGRSSIRAFISGTILAGEARGRWRLVPIQANAQPAFAWYLRDESRGNYQAYAIQVLTIEGNLLADVTTFGFPSLFPYFDLALELQAS
jgi:RNA polymerase sigma-70 factor (ECF subfamily)